MNIHRIRRGMLAAGLLLCTATSALAEISLQVPDRYTAQRRPRVSVLDFEDTNKEAVDTKYGASVQAMLVTFLKRKSQFVVVERLKVGNVLEEWQRNQRGQTTYVPEDPRARDLLEKIDAIIIGSVTVLPRIAEAKTVESSEDASGDKKGTQGATAEDLTRSQKRERIDGPRVEIDVKLLSRVDGRIIAAAQRNGPVGCLRYIVERLGIALEQEYLRPYFGNLKFSLSHPDNVRIFLTPVLMDNALDEERPPVERSSSLILDVDHDKIEPWATAPTSYEIQNLLSGWYSMRLERPGYEGLGTENDHWVAREDGSKLEIYSSEGVPLSKLPADQRRFIVRVEPLKTKMLDGDSHNISFRNLKGSVAPRIRRQYLDKDFTEIPDRILLIGSEGLEINRANGLPEYSEDENCDFFDERKPAKSIHGTTHVATGHSFDINTFKGGELILEDYKGEEIPAGTYRMVLWEPHYESLDAEVAVRDGEQQKPINSAMVRKSQPLTLTATGPKPPHKAILEGRETGNRIEIPLNFYDREVLGALPVDFYRISTSIPGFGAWEKSVELLPSMGRPPVYDTESKVVQLGSQSEPPANVPTVPVKTRLVLGGRLQALSSVPDTVNHDVYINSDLARLLDEVLGGARHDSPAVWRDLNEGLQSLDVLVLDGEDMARLRARPRVATLITQYIANGGALFAFVEEAGDYAHILGTPLSIAVKGKKTRELALSPGQVSGVVFDFPRDKKGNIKKIRVKRKRILPRIEDLPESWRIVAHTRGTKEPRIVERGYHDQGGYVLLWLDRPEAFRGRRGGRVAEVEAARVQLENHVLSWARSLMARRFDKVASDAQAAPPCKSCSR